ncbi:hypothetical protein BH11BAC2_BH11BAC2_24520 [soil metagenome]
MKNFRTFTQTLIFAGLCITFNQVAASTNHAGQTKTATVLYQSEWIPSVTLKEVVITERTSEAPSKGTLCEMKHTADGIIASVEMKEVTIKSSGDYTNDTKVVSGLVFPTIPSKLVPAVKVNGVYMAQVNLQEVSISADNEISANPILSMNQSGTDNQLRISVRKAFDRLATYAFDSAKNLVRKVVPSWLGE